MENIDSHQQHLNQVTLIGMLVAIGIVFGDIGTSPLYTFSAVIGSKPVEPLLALGGLLPSSGRYFSRRQSNTSSSRSLPTTRGKGASVRSIH